MAMNDWNGDGKNNRIDNLIEYSVFSGNSKGKGKRSYSSGGMWVIGAFVTAGFVDRWI